MLVALIAGAVALKRVIDERSASHTYPDATRDELYEEAKRLDIPGRSSMKKDELRRAVEARRTAGGSY